MLVVRGNIEKGIYVMITNLYRIKTEIEGYLQRVSVSAEVVPLKGSTVNPGEKFTIKIISQNPDEDNEGLALRNLRYRLELDNSSVALFVVPDSFAAVDFSGAKLMQGSEVSGMLIDLSGSASGKISVGEIHEFQVSAIALESVEGGDVLLNARLYASIDLNYIFPRMEGELIEKEFSVID